MAGNTATIDFVTLKIQWDSHSAMASICSYWTITKDQLIRLKGVVPLAPRHDRRFRFKPKRSEIRDPTPREIEQAKREIQAKWDARTRDERCVYKCRPVTLMRIELSDELRAALEEPSDGDS
jgi:hypothetical protein